MALSPSASQGRANLIREMARSHHSNLSDSGSERASAVGFDNDSHILPTTTPRNVQQSGDSFQINTSALRRAFPDFSQYGSSDGGDSIEVGRAAPLGRPGSSGILPSEDPSENISLNIGGEHYTVTGTPPMKPKTMKRMSLGKENADPDARDTDRLSERPRANQSRPTRFGRHTQEDTQQSAEVNQSFALPNLPNITELVSGQRQDGTPLFPKTAKPRSRFATPASQQARHRTDLPSIDGVPVPADAQALYIALQLLQEKVVTLEQEKTEAVEQADQYELELLQLKAAQEAKQHSDSGVDVDNEDDTRIRDFDAERLRFEASIKSLKSKLDKANKKLSASNVQISQLKGDKAAATHQLEEAEANSVVLREEGQVVHEEFEDVKSQLARVTKQHEKLITKFTQQEAELRKKIDRRERAVQEMAFLARELYATRHGLKATTSGVSEEKQARTESRADNSRQRRPSRKPSTSTVNGIPSEQRTATRLAPVELTGNTTIEVDDPEYTTELDLGSQPLRAVLPELTKNESFMSFMEGDEVAKLRNVLEQDQARAAGSVEHRYTAMKDETLNAPTERQRIASAAPAKSSLKRTPSSVQQHEQAPTVTDIREETQASILSQRSNRRRRSSGPSASEMTSAFILQDITLTGTGNQGAAKQTKIVKRPHPVSDRPLSAFGESTDFTVRPEQSPGVALANVLQSLEEEVSRLRARLAQQERLYHQHDPALSKQERKTVFGRIQRLLAAVELRCDQIYALYDVLEGQKDAGQCMDQSEVEVTLHNLGIQLVESKATHGNTSAVRPRSNSAASSKGNVKERRKSVVIDVDDGNVASDDDLPIGESDDEHFPEFDGFGDTTNTNSQSMRA